jgi:collagenase-like PrtC family protease
VLARELHLNEIKEIKQKIPWVELEVFVHWAMCMTYSGRCLLWEYFSGRDGNKWECSHVCRYKYKVYLEEEKRPWKLFQLEDDWDWSYIMSSKDLCTIEKLWELLPYVDGLKIEWRSKSEFYVWSCVKSYKHVRDSIINWNEIDDNIKNLVYEIPHRYYWDGFLFNDIRTMPDGEDQNEISDESQMRSDIINTTTKDTAWPIAERQYMGLIMPEFIDKNWKKYFKFDAKDNILRWDKFKFMSSYWLWEIIVVDILDDKWNEIERWHCNYDFIYICFDKDMKWWECLYK